jgi:hypothetical protein
MRSAPAVHLPAGADCLCWSSSICLGRTVTASQVVQPCTRHAVFSGVLFSKPPAAGIKPLAPGVDRMQGHPPDRPAEPCPSSRMNRRKSLAARSATSPSTHPTAPHRGEANVRSCRDPLT